MPPRRALPADPPPGTHQRPFLARRGASYAGADGPPRVLKMSVPERRLPPPWSAEETDACFIVRDGNAQALAYVYFEEERGRRAAAHLLTRDEAGRIFVAL